MSTPRIHKGFSPLLAVLIMAAGALHAPVARAQQDPMYTMYMWNMMSVNPGYAGSADLMNLTVLGRRQWTGVNGAPSTNSFMVHTPLRNKALGVGLSFVNDRIGPSATNGIFGQFAYRIRLSGRTRLAFGLSAGFNTMNMDMASVPGVDLNDPIFQRNVNSGPEPNFGFGLYCWNKKTYVGLSSPKLLNSELLANNESGDVRVYQQELHYFLIAGHVFDLSPDVKFRPSLQVKAVGGAPLSSDISANFLLREKLWTGVAYRTSHDMSAILSYQINDQLRAGYSYDMSLNPLRSQYGGSHELMLSYDLTFTKHFLRSPRYF